MSDMDEMFSRGWKFGGAAAVFVLLCSCARIGNYAEKRADRAAYANIGGAQQAVFGEQEVFTIDAEEAERIRTALEQESIGDDPKMLSLADVLAIAMANSREYQTRKESLFIDALNLTQVQKDFNHDFNGSFTTSSSYKKNKDGTTETFGNAGLDETLAVGVKRVLLTGAEVSLDFSQNLTAYFSSPDAGRSGSALSFSVVQPLLRGFGPLVSKEPLRQAERDMIYSVRDFRRYQQGFVIDIASLFYSTLRSGDALRNARFNYESAIENRKQTESYAKAGRIAEFEAAQARQSELDAADRWILSQTNYRDALDDLRFTLGLPIDLNVAPDTNELRRLELRGLVEVDVSQQEAMQSAISNRLDLITKREQVEDKKRKLKIRRQDFLPNLDVTYDVKKEFTGDDGSAVKEELGVGLDLPFDWTEKRNAYRIAQIALEREIRGLEEEEDQVRRTVRDLWRKLERNRSVYKNRLLSVELSKRRVESTTLLLKQGKALTRDLLEAEDDLLSSRNAATVALVDYTINRLRFWNAIERFEIDPKGMWYERADKEAPVAAPQQ